jgi:hypothetical protein
MSFTYEVDKDKTVTILNEGTVFLTQKTDPTVGGGAKFKTTEAASAWAEEAIEVFKAELAEQAKVDEESIKAAEAIIKAEQEALGSHSADSEAVED